VAIPAWANGLIACVLAGITVFYLVRVLAGMGASAIRAPGLDRSSDLAHVLMAAGMATMLLSLDRPLTATGWQVVFLADAAWFAVLLIRGSLTVTRDVVPAARLSAAMAGRRLHHVIANLSMVYMFATDMPEPSMMDMPGMATSGSIAHSIRLPALAWLIIVYFAGYTAWSLGRLLARTTTAVGAQRSRRSQFLWHQPRVCHACHAAMGAAMAAMLLPML
jgi:hypothetical protein